MELFCVDVGDVFVFNMLVWIKCGENDYKENKCWCRAIWDLNTNCASNTVDAYLSADQDVRLVNGIYSLTTK